MKKFLDDKVLTEANLMDQSKAFDTLNHELLIANLSGNGITNEFLKLIKS